MAAKKSAPAKTAKLRAETTESGIVNVRDAEGNLLHRYGARFSPDMTRAKREAAAIAAFERDYEFA